jgi:3-deoxy-D-manno-octulosonate 8-phosphate phosphatase (KDO 8-P phosphatase)
MEVYSNGVHMPMIEEKAGRLKLLLLDVDGVMTNGSIFIGEQGEETKSFHVRDGLGLKLLIANGIDVIIVTGRRSSAVERRIKELGIQGLYQGISDKQSLCRKLIREKGLKKDEVCAMGDDLPDLPMFKEAGVCITVGDAVREVREACDFITKSKGGSGAVREACEWILKSQGKWPDVLAMFSGK